MPYDPFASLMNSQPDPLTAALLRGQPPPAPMSAGTTAMDLGEPFPTGVYPEALASMAAENAPRPSYQPSFSPGEFDIGGVTAPVKPEGRGRRIAQTLLGDFATGLAEAFSQTQSPGLRAFGNAFLVGPRRRQQDALLQAREERERRLADRYAAQAETQRLLAEAQLREIMSRAGKHDAQAGLAGSRATQFEDVEVDVPNMGKVTIPRGRVAQMYIQSLANQGRETTANIGADARRDVAETQGETARDVGWQRVQGQIEAARVRNEGRGSAAGGGGSEAGRRRIAQARAYSALSGKIAEDMKTVHAGKNVDPANVVDYYLDNFGKDLGEGGVDVVKLRKDLLGRFAAGAALRQRLGGNRGR